ncbi:hypothetical protein GCM10009410_21200 [Shewanella ulleungensis]|uniref:Uncharacterized protein n=1 Tax=Shewanella ulleungensis TaxID=2282699 RepID=A0ABQ2QNM7_9GAMM|nr:hypothetical protein GCM10009410_21200 [Shewanella ulleungensis]
MLDTAMVIFSFDIAVSDVDLAEKSQLTIQHRMLMPKIKKTQFLNDALINYFQSVWGMFKCSNSNNFCW